MLRVTEAAEAVGVCRDTVWRWVHAGYLPARRAGAKGIYWIDAEDLKRVRGASARARASRRSHSAMAAGGHEPQVARCRDPEGGNDEPRR
jgi:excisionase family DNA binding protein